MRKRDMAPGTAPDSATFGHAGAHSPPRRAERLQPEWQRASRRELWWLAVYFAAVIVLTDIVNVRLGVELLTLVVLIPAFAITRQPAQFLRDWWFFLVGLVLWNLSGPIAAQSPFPWHLDFMLNLDRTLFLGHQPVVVVQHAFISPDHITPMDLFTVIVYNMHLPEPYIAAYFLWRLNRLVYLQFASAALALLILGYVTFILFPAIPPWMASGRYHRIPNVVNQFGPVLHAHPLPFHGSPIFKIFNLQGDPVAAFPSEHAAFPLLELLAFRCVIGKKAIWLILWIAAVVLAVLYLGEHWFVDVLAGWLYAAVIFFAVRRVTRAC
jgi:membrane-associated phospholipid phosphatase